MLTSSHIVRLTGIALTLWALATACIHLWPRAFLDYTMAALGFVISLPMALLSVRLTRKLAGLEMSQLLAGVTLVGAIAMVIDGVMLRFVPWIYGSDDALLRAGAAWLLWGYGVSLAFAFLWVSREERTALPEKRRGGRTPEGTPA
jgi:hypothetical protein